MLVFTRYWRHQVMLVPFSTSRFCGCSHEGLRSAGSTLRQTPGASPCSCLGSGLRLRARRLHEACSPSSYSYALDGGAVPGRGANRSGGRRSASSHWSRHVRRDCGAERSLAPRETVESSVRLLRQRQGGLVGTCLAHRSFSWLLQLVQGGPATMGTASSGLGAAPSGRGAASFLHGGARRVLEWTSDTMLKVCSCRHALTPSLCSFEH